MGFAIGMAAGLTAGLLAAPMRGRDMRASIRQRAVDGNARLQSLAESGRSWAQHTADRAVSLVEEGRRALSTRGVRTSEPQPLTASLGDIATMHELTHQPMREERQ